MRRYTDERFDLLDAIIEVALSRRIEPEVLRAQLEGLYRARRVSAEFLNRWTCNGAGTYAELWELLEICGGGASRLTATAGESRLPGSSSCSSVGADSLVLR